MLHDEAFNSSLLKKIIIMPVNRNALIRYKTLDKCLQNRYRQWTLENLIDACSDALYEYEGIDKGVSRRTVQADIQMMRSDKLGYNAPIVVVDRKYYTYEDKEYSITNIPLTDQDLGMLSEAVAFLKEFKGFSHFRDLDGMIQKLEDHVYSQKTKQEPIIDFEKNEGLKGLEYLDQLYQAIIKRKTVVLTYQSFKAREANCFLFHPYLLKEYRNRWFVLGVRGDTQPIMTLALDRILDIEISEESFYQRKYFEASSYFHDVVGVTVNANQNPQEVLLFVERGNAPYVLTKPIHHSQKLVKKEHNGVVISLQVQINFELERVILGFGDGVKVLAPANLKRRIKGKLLHAIDAYHAELDEKFLKNCINGLGRRGIFMLPNVFTDKEKKQLGKPFHQYLEQHEKGDKAPTVIENIFDKFADLRPMLFNSNLKRIVNAIDKNAFLMGGRYFHRTPQTAKSLAWHQQQKIKMKGKGRGKLSVEVLKTFFIVHLHLDEISEKYGALQVASGSQNKILNKDEIALITQNSVPHLSEVKANSIQVFRPLLLHRYTKSANNKRTRIIELIFGTKEF